MVHEADMRDLSVDYIRIGVQDLVRHEASTALAIVEIYE